MRLTLLLTLFCLLSTHLIAQNPYADRTFSMGFHTGVMRETARRDAVISFRFLVQKITRFTGIRKIDTFFYEDIERMRHDFETRRIDLIFAAPLDIVRHFDLETLEEGMASNTGSAGAEAIVLLTRKNGPHTRVADLRGKKLLTPENEPIIAAHLDNLAYDAFETDAKHAFKLHESDRRASLLIYDLFFRRTDAIAVYKNSFAIVSDMNPQITDQIRVLSEYQINNRTFSFFHKAFDPGFRRYILEKAMALSGHPLGRQILELFQTDTLRITTRDDLSPLVALQRRHQRFQMRYAPTP